MNNTQKIENKISKMYHGAKVSNVVIDEEFGNITANIEGVGTFVDCGLTRDFQKIYHLRDVQGWKAEVNIMAV